MSLGVIALLVAIGGAFWLLMRLVRGDGDRGNMTIFKAVIWLGLAAALFTIKLWPLALMTLLAAGGVMAIEMWREREIKVDESHDVAPPSSTAIMSIKEAAAVLGIGEGASEQEIRDAHKKLISQIHPDRGGTDYLAAKINEARDKLLDSQK